MTIEQLETQIQEILYDDNPQGIFDLNFGHKESIIFLNGRSDQFIMHKDDLKRLEMVLGRKFAGICFIKNGFSMSFIQE